MRDLLARDQADALDRRGRSDCVMQGPIQPTNWIGSVDGDRLALHILAVRGPSNDPHCWLWVQGNINWSGRIFQFRDECLLHCEAVELISWLNRPPAESSEIRFTEPLLGFAWDNAIPDKLFVRLRAEAVPEAWFDWPDDKWSRGIVLEIDANANARNRFAATLNRELKTR